MLFAPSVARADAPRLEVPSTVMDCPSAGELRHAIVGEVGRDDFDGAAAPLVVVRARPEDDGSLSADIAITLRGEPTTARTIRGAGTCAELVRAAALSVALAIDISARTPPRGERPQEEEAKSEETTGPKSEVAHLPEEQRHGSESLRDDRVVVAVSALSSLGVLPRPAAGGGLAARVRVTSALWLSTRGYWFPEASMPGDDFSLRLLAAGAGACVEPLAGRAAAALLCGHLVGGSYDVRHATVGMADRSPATYLAASLSVGGRARVLGPIHLEGSIDAQLPLVRPTFVTTECPPRGFEPAFVAVAMWLGGGVSFR